MGIIPQTPPSFPFLLLPLLAESFLMFISLAELSLAPTTEVLPVTLFAIILHLPLTLPPSVAAVPSKADFLLILFLLILFLVILFSVNSLPDNPCLELTQR